MDGGISGAAADQDAATPPSAPVLAAFVWNPASDVRRSRAEGIADDVVDYFRYEEDGESLTIAYPWADADTKEGIVYPSNSSVLELFLQRENNDRSIFKVEFVGANGITYEHYPPPCGLLNCTLQIPSPELLYLGQELAGSSVDLTVYSASKDGQSVSRSNTVPLRFSRDALDGIVYYRTTETNGLKRAAYGISGKAVNFVIPGSDDDPFQYVVDQSVSVDGAVAAYAVTTIGRDGAGNEITGDDIAGLVSAPTTGGSAYFEPEFGDTPYAGDPVTRGLTMGPTDHLGHAVALNPDGTLAAVNGLALPSASGAAGPPYLEILDARSGDVLSHYDAGDESFGEGYALPIHPAWSPDGSQLAFTLAGNGARECVWTTATCRGQIVTFDVDRRGRLSNRTLIVSTEETSSAYSPAWSPDGEWIAFVSAPTPGPGFGSGEGTQGNPSAALYLVASTPGHMCPGDCIRLAAAMAHQEGKTVGNPMFAPQLVDDGSLLYLTFASDFDYGRNAGKLQIWGTALVVKRAVGAQDPSTPPFWLTFQSDAASNSDPAWSRSPPCSADAGVPTCSGCLADEECLVNRVTSTCTCTSRLPR